MPFYDTQIINPILSSMISDNYYKVEGFQPIVKSLYRFVVYLFWTSKHIIGYKSLRNQHKF